MPPITAFPRWADVIGSLFLFKPNWKQLHAVQTPLGEIRAIQKFFSTLSVKTFLVRKYFCQNGYR